MADDLHLRDNPAQQRYEIHVGGQLAGFAEYRDVSTARMLTHTEIGQAYEGQGLASKLIKYALDDLRAHNLHAVPMCPFVASYIRRHREYVDLVQPAQRGVFGL